MFKLSTSKDSQGSFSWIYFVHRSNVQMHQMHPAIFSSQCLPHLETRFRFLSSSLTGGSQLASSDKRQLREHGMKFLPLVSVGTLYLAYESANFRPISLQIAAATRPWVPKPGPGLQAPYVSRIVTGFHCSEVPPKASGEALPLPCG